MARIIPSDYTALEYSNSHEGELETLRRLQKELPNDYTVFHSLHWSNERPRYSIFGEIDFVVVNKAGHILVIEQKNGALEESEEGLIKVYGRDRKNVAGQVHRQVNNIQDKLKKYHGGTKGIEIDYLVYLPDYRVVRLNAAGLDKSRVVDQSQMGDLAKIIEQQLGPGSDSDPGFSRSIQNFFRQSLEVVPAVSTYITSQEKSYTRMLAGLGDVIDNIEFSPFRLRVIGTAGSGKSQLTMRFFQRALARGKRPLLLCFNRALADRLQQIAEDETNVNSFHGFCTRVAEQAGIAIDYSKVSEPGFWQSVLDNVLEVEVTEDDKYDCLIVDEGQDFEQDWYERLELFLNAGAEVLWLEDPLQNLLNRSPVELDGFVTYRETANFRSPTSISKFIKAALDVDFVQRNTLPGLGAAVHTYEQDMDQAAMVAHRVTDLMRIGFKPEEIVVISCRGQQAATLKGLEKVGNYRLRQFLGEYTEEGRQAFSDGQIYFDTIFRFKGQQAPVIIVTDIHKDMKVNDWAKRILYCAMTRATVRLELLVDQESPWSEKLQSV